MNKISDAWLRRLVNLWSFVFLAAVIIDLLYVNAYKDILSTISTIYIGVLVIYGSNKELNRWQNHHKANHKGEIFIIFWTILMGVLIFFDIFLGPKYKLPESVITTYISVLTILAITERSKEMHGTKKEKNPV